MKDYYSAKDVKEIAGISTSLSYQIIAKLRASFEKEYPSAIPLQGRIPIWYFEEKMKNRRGETNE